MRHLFLLSALSLATLASPAYADEQARTVGAFNAIDIRGPISIEVESGKEQSLTLRGDQKFLGNVITEVVDGELKISLKDKDSKKRKATRGSSSPCPPCATDRRRRGREDPHQGSMARG